MLTTMKVIADMLWVMPPARAPQSSAENRLPVHRLAVLRSCRLANVFRFSVRSHIPTTNRPSPPVTPAKSSFMPVCNSPTLLRSRCRTTNSRADSVPVIPRRRRLACKSSQYPYYSQSKCITRSALAGIGAEENDGALGRRLEARLAEPAVRHEQIRVAVIVGRGRRMASLLIPIPKLRIRRPGDAPPASTALSSTRSIALSPSTRVISVLQPAEPMSCLVLSVQPVRMPLGTQRPAARLAGAGTAAHCAHSVG